MTNSTLFWRNLRLVYQSAPRQALLLLCLNIVMIFAPILFTYCGARIVGIIADLIKNGTQTIDLWALLMLQPALLVYILVMIVLGTLSDSIETLLGFVSDTMSDKLQGNIEFCLMQKIGAMPGLSLFEHPERAKDLALTNKGLERLRQFIELVMYVGKGAISLVIITFLLIDIAWWVPLLMIVATAPAMLFAYRVESQSWQIEESHAEDTRKMSLYRQMLMDVNYSKDVRIFDYQPKIQQRWQTHYHNVMASMLTFRRRASLKMLLWAFVSGFGKVAPMFYVVHGVVLGKFDLSQLALFIGFIFQIRTALANVMYCYGDLLAVLKASKPIFNVLDYQSDIADGEENIQHIDRIEFKNVVFCYPKVETPSLNGINVLFEKGKTYTIVGENGAGKTTLIKLLLRFYDPNSGEILINGQRLTNLSLNAYRNLSASVFQDFARFRMSVGDNISSIDLDAELANKLRRSLRIDAHLEQSLDIEDTNGRDLSGGQWQKLAIARAKYRSAISEIDLMVLDEPTSALDPMIENEIFNQFRQMTKHKIGIIVSHRLAMAKHSDEILVVDKGRIVERGHHDTLIENKGHYAEMFAKQSSAYVNH